MTSSPAPQTVAGGSAGPDLLRVNDIAKSYAGVQALAGVSLEVKAGEILTLVGENGSGKSTLIKIVAGVETADAGTVLIDGQDWTGASPIQRIEAGVQIIYQDFALFPNLSAAENVWLPQQQHGRRRIVDRAAGRITAVHDAAPTACFGRFARHVRAGGGGGRGGGGVVGGPAGAEVAERSRDRVRREDQEAGGDSR